MFHSTLNLPLAPYLDSPEFEYHGPETPVFASHAKPKTAVGTFVVPNFTVTQDYCHHANQRPTPCMPPLERRRRDKGIYRAAAAIMIAPKTAPTKPLWALLPALAVVFPEPDG